MKGTLRKIRFVLTSLELRAFEELALKIKLFAFYPEPEKLIIHLTSLKLVLA